MSRPTSGSDESNDRAVSWSKVQSFCMSSSWICQSYWWPLSSGFDKLVINRQHHVSVLRGTIRGDLKDTLCRVRSLILLFGGWLYKHVTRWDRDRWVNIRSRWRRPVWLKVPPCKSKSSRDPVLPASASVRFWMVMVALAPWSMLSRTCCQVLMVGHYSFDNDYKVPHVNTPYFTPTGM